jgi:tRNA-Thr(GGU) m(6)t(6)A37 methyltransferase TsaA
MNVREWTVRPLGVIRTPHERMEDAPRQPTRARGVPGRVEVYPDLVEGLEGIERYSHIYLIFAFDRVKATELSATPPGEDEPRGVFATRSPRRPGGIGMSLVRLVSRDGATLYVEDVDMLDRSPLLDIKPYIEALDSP